MFLTMKFILCAFFPFLITDLVAAEEKLCSFDFSPTFLSKIFNLKLTNLLSLLEELKTLEVTEKEVDIILYTEDSKSYSLNDEDNFKLLNPNCDTKIIIHGWHASGKDSWIKEMSLNYHKKGKYNTIAIDWSKHSKKNYLHAVYVTQHIAEILVDFIVKTEKKIENFSKKVHFIGHSLGAHISGFVGKKLKEIGKKLDRITGCDAAAPLFEFPLKKIKCGLSKTDADFVDLIHTENLGGYGVMQPYGVVDFYVNDGLYQPNCTKTVLDLFNPVMCGHSSSHQIFSQTIINPKAYEATSCSNLLMFKTGLCKENTKAFLGDSVDRSVSGKFYIKITTEEFNNVN